MTNSIPLFVLDPEGAIPIPGGVFHFCHSIEDAANTLNSSSEDPIFVGLAIKKPSSSQLSFLDQSIDGIEKIGVLAELVTLTNSDQEQQMTLHIKSRIEIMDFNSEDDSLPLEKQKLSLEDDHFQYYRHGYVPAAEKQFLSSKIKILRGAMQEYKVPEYKKLLIKLRNSKNPVKQFDILADAIIKSSEERIKYLSSVSLEAQWELLFSIFKSTVVESNTKKMPITMTGEPLPERLKKLPLNPTARKKIIRDVQRLEEVPKNSNEYGNIIDYLTWVADIPWGRTTYQQPNLKDLISALDTTHYGLKDVKEHVLEHMTIEQIKGNSKGAVLCFLGPPGTGKTSIAKEIAKVTNRAMQRIALGGVSDEAELRGHRRTYLSSRPGRIVTGLKQAGTMDPLFILDEIDKLSSYKGSPADALLEVLDPEQNSEFVDNYLELPIDLSSAMFICTANYWEQIPPALKDRMDIIHFKEYAKAERMKILVDHIIPKSLSEFQLQNFNIDIQDDVIDKLSDIKQVRQIENTLKKLLRMAAVQIVVFDRPKVVIDLDFAQKIFSKPQLTKGQMGFGS